ncbi:MAG: GIY-YIG nuclease family protein [Candidatus Acetothermia bacterium]
MPEPRELQIGNLEPRRYKGSYLYVGSARGNEGYGRVNHHIRVAQGIREGKHWHVDLLLPVTNILQVWLLPTDKERECQLAQTLAKEFPEAVEGFGCSDCNCNSHLFSCNDGNSKSILRALENLPVGAKPFSFDL